MYLGAENLILEIVNFAKQKQVAEYCLAELAKKNEERRHRDERAAHSARDARNKLRNMRPMKGFNKYKIVLLLVILKENLNWLPRR